MRNILTAMTTYNAPTIDQIHRLFPPIYQDAHVTVYHGDCLQILPLLPRADIMLTDPPYGIGVAPRGTVGSSAKPGHKRSSSWATAKCTTFKPVDWDDAPPSLWLMQMAISRAKQSIIWGGGHIGGMSRATCWLVWDKRNDGMGFSNAEIAWTNLPRAVRMFRWRWSGCRQEDMRRKERRVHPTQKPVPLMEWCLKFTRGAATVLDPFAGSGSTLLAARNLGMRAIGIERDLDYCRIAAARLSDDARCRAAESPTMSASLAE